MFIKKLILAMFNLVKKIIIEIDASRIALGLILSQFDKEKRLYPIIFYFRKFIISELNYDIHDKKLLTIVNCQAGRQKTCRKSIWYCVVY